MEASLMLCKKSKSQMLCKIPISDTLVNITINAFTARSQYFLLRELIRPLLGYLIPIPGSSCKTHAPTHAFVVAHQMRLRKVLVMENR